MKPHKINAFLLSFFLVSAISSSAQHNAGDLSYTLIASRNTIQKIYSPGSRFFLKYTNHASMHHCRGVFTGITDDKIVITTNKRKRENILIAPGDIILLRKIKPGKRILYGGIGTALVAGGAALINNAGDTPGSAIGGAIVIPFIGAGVFFLGAIPVMLLVEKLNEKNTANGWKFTIEKNNFH